MRKIYAVLAGVVLGLAFNINAAPMQLSAQPVQSIGGVQPAQADSFSSINLTATPVQAAPISLNADDMSSLRLLSDEQLTTFVNALDATPTIPVASLPRGGRVGTFWSLQNPTWPPLPFDSSVAAAWPMSDGGYLLNDLNFNYDAPQKGSLKSGGSMQATAMSSPPGFGAGGGAGSFTPNDLNYTAPDYGTNLWIAQAALASGYLTGIGSNTLADIQYEIQSKTNLLQTNWLSEGFILGSEITNWTPLSVAKGSRTNLFIRLRSWIDSDNVGIPDWWQLQYFGYVGINPYAASPAGDGYTIWQKYQSGLNPTNFETPPAPNNFVAVLSTNGTNVLLSWNSAQGTVTHYSIVRGVYNSGTGNYDYSTIATVSPSTTSFVNVGAIQNANDQYDLYELSAEYPGGNSSQTAYSSIYATAPPTATSPAPAYNIYVSATLVRNATGRWQLMFSGLPSNVQTIRLYWNSTTQSISASVLTNGIYRIPDTDVVNYLGDTVSVQGFGVNGEPGQIVQVGILPNDAPYFVDGRQHMKQNLSFLIRGASETEPFFASYYDEGFLEFGFGYLGLFADVTQFRFNTSSTNFEEFSFLHHGIQLDDLWPFAANSDLANYFVDTTRTNTFPFGSTNFTFTLNFATNIPAPPVLTRADPYWILQAGFNPASYRYTATNWAVSITATQTVATLASGGKNLFGLPYQAGCEVDMQYGNSGFFSVNSLYQILDTGSSVTANSGYMIGDFASWCPAPTLVLNSYYFASLINPNANPMNLPGEIDPYDGSNFQPFPLPIDDDFNVTNQTPPLIIGAVGQPMILGGWAKYAISNSSPTKYAYLGQYFVTNAFLLNTNGTVTTNIAGILSPYGEFFPTQAGRAQLITMPDIDTGKQGTNIVQIISLNVDANHDGTMDLSYFGQDQTSPGKPYVFWCNNNFDRWHKVDGTDFEQDDMPPQGAPDCNLTDDYGHRIIPCARDLEDFTRLWISGVTSNLLATLPIGSSVILSWGDVSSPNSGNPTIDLFAAADTDGGIGYLTNATVAAQQTNSSAAAYIGRLGPGDSIQLNSLMNQLPTTHFIWCGVTNGSGKLTLTFKNPSGNILGQASVYIQIVDIKQMYE